MLAIVADVIAMVLFSTIIGMAIELLLSGLTLTQSLQSRLTAIPLNLITARPYGLWRDWVGRRFKVESGGQIRQAIADTLAFLLFQVPLYFGILLLSGAHWKQALVACGTITLLSSFLGRPYGLWLDAIRRIFRVRSAK